MRIRGGWALGVLLCAAAAAAQPVINDPTPDDPDDTGFQLDVQEVLSGFPLDTPTGMVFIGAKDTEDFLVLEKHTGRIRHFLRETALPPVRVELPVALDLDVDTCGDRGLIGIAGHPEFDLGGDHVLDPENPQQDWIYVSFFDNAGNPDGCGPSAATFRVVRYRWDGSALVDPMPIYSKALLAGETTAVGGVIATTRELQFGTTVTNETRLYVLIGSLNHDGKLQNNKLGADLDDTSVMLRLDQNGGTPPDNPFDDPNVTTPETKDRYFAYGFRDPRGVAADPVSQGIWFTEYSDDGKPDEINQLFGARNGGYKAYQGKAPDKIPDNNEPAYPLFDLSVVNNKPVSTYLQPRFSFMEDGAFRPNGVAFGGTEVGPQHREDLFVGTEDGNILRFIVQPARTGFTLVGDLADQIAHAVTPGADPPRADDLSSIWIGKEFGRVSELETGSDGSIYSVDQDAGKIYRLFFNGARDLVVTSVKVPTKISISDKKPVVSKLIRVNIVNQGEVNERIDSHDELRDFLGLEILPLAPSNCAPPEWDVVDPKYVMPPYSYPIGIKFGGGKLAVDVNVSWTCDNDPVGAPDFETRVHLDPASIGVPELLSEVPNNDCPRPPLPPDDPGCGPKGGGPFVTDIIEK